MVNDYSELSPEFREFLKSFVHIESTVDRSGGTLEELGQKAIESAKHIAHQSSRDRARIMHRLKIEETDDLDAAIESVIQERLLFMSKNLELRLASAQTQAVNGLATAIERGYIAEPKELHIYFVDLVLQLGLPKDEQHGTNAFIVEENRSYISLDEPNRIVTHELGHALANRPDSKEGGVLRYGIDAEGRKKSWGNHWFDEGATVMWEDRSVIDNVPKEGREDPMDYWHWSQEAAQLILQEAGIDEEIAMRAYFGHIKDRQQLDEALQRRFGTNLDGLDALSQRLDINWTKKIISGQPVTLTWRNKYDHSSMLESITKLSAVFPNVEVVKE